MGGGGEFEPKFNKTEMGGGELKIGRVFSGTGSKLMRRKKVNVFLTDMFTRTDEKNRTSTRVRRFINTLTEGWDRTDSVPVSW